MSSGSLADPEAAFQQDKKELEYVIETVEDEYDHFTADNLDNVWNEYNGNTGSLFVTGGVWQNTYWDQMDSEDRSEYLGRMLRDTLQRAESQPIYGQSEAFQDADPDNIDTLEDVLFDFPVLSKDGEEGFRDRVVNDPELMLPRDRGVQGLGMWESGGSGGGSTVTWLSRRDLDIDASGQVRGNQYGAIDEDGIVINGYNPTHKGGQVIPRATELGSGHSLPMRPEEDADDVVDKMRRYDVVGLAAVETGQGVDEKGGGKNFFSLMQKDFDTVMDVDNWFVTGYPLVDDLVETSEASPVATGDGGERNRLFTTYGTSEAIPLATSTVAPDAPAQYNAQHLMYGPHHLEVAVEEDGELRPADDGEYGIALVTTIDRRDGTIYVNYALGDGAVMVDREPEDSPLNTPIIDDIEKLDDPTELIEGGCTVV